MLAATLFRFSRMQLPLALCFFATAWSQPVLEPETNPNGTLGMSNLVSGEAMGIGRLTVNMRGNFYQQQKAFVGAPAKNVQVYTGTGALAFGVAPSVDVFAALSAYNLSDKNGSGLGTSSFGIQGSVPFGQSFPARLGLQLAVLPGTDDIKTQIDTNRVDGYNYFETRSGTDFIIRLMQSILFIGDDMSVKLHFNEGVVSSLEKNKDPLLLQGVGLEFLPHPSVIVGLELNSRTYFKDSQTSDPLWVTPSLTFRTESHLNASVGSDLSLSPGRAHSNSRALEPWRVFGALTLSFDLMGNDTRAAAERARQDSLQRLALANKNRVVENRVEVLVPDTIGLRAQQDSLNMLRERAIADSIAMADLRRQLEAARYQRPPEEKKLLSTGELMLDAAYFESGKTDVSLNSKPYLAIVAKMLIKYPKLQIEISGHTDNSGLPAKNLRLSQQRAEAVMKVMINAAPELEGHLIAKGYGSSQPKSSNKTPAGRKLNRRTELQVLNKDALKEYNTY